MTMSTNPPLPTGLIPAHPLAELFPRIGRRALQEMAGSIHLHGLLEPIVLIYDEDESGEMVVRILDGRNRDLACRNTRHADKHLRFVWFHEIASSDTDPTDWVMAKNLNRRHLTANQRKDAAAKFTEYISGRARLARQAAAAETNAQRWGTEPDAPSSADSSPQQMLPSTPQPSGRARDLAAAEFNVSATAVQTTRRIRRDGAEGLADLHRDEKVTTTTAAEIARLPKADQLDIVEAVKKADEPCEARKLARQLLDEHRSRITTLPQPDAEPAPTAAETPPTAVSSSSTATPTADVAKFYALPDRGEVPISRNAIEVLLAVVGGEHDHPYRDQAIAAVLLQLKHDEWAA